MIIAQKEVKDKIRNQKPFPTPSLDRAGSYNDYALKRKIETEALSRTHGQIKYLPKLTWAARINRKKSTEAEEILWEKVLRRKQTGYKFVRQKPIDRFILDFYCSKLSLAIEVDGSSHQNKKSYDTERDSFLRQIGIGTLRFTNDEILDDDDVDAVRQKIFDHIPQPALSRERGPRSGGRV